MSFNIEYLLSALPHLASAALVNARLAAIIVIIAMFGGTALTILQTFKIRPLNTALNILISFIRGTPLLIQIFLFYYVMPSIGINLRPEVAGVAAISLNSSIFITIMMRSGLQGMDPGQIEAASALALSRRAIWQKVILPQLFRRILPLLVNEITIIIKGTALLSVITVVDVLRTAQHDPPPLNWSTLNYVFWQTGGPRCRRSATSPKRSSRSCARSMCWSRRGNPLPMRSVRSA